MCSQSFYLFPVEFISYSHSTSYSLRLHVSNWHSGICAHCVCCGHMWELFVQMGRDALLHAPNGVEVKNQKGNESNACVQANVCNDIMAIFFSSAFCVGSITSNIGNVSFLPDE